MGNQQSKGKVDKDIVKLHKNKNIKVLKNKPNKDSDEDKKKTPIFNDSVQIEIRNKVINNQMEEIIKNENVLNNVEQDLTTLRRQIEITENSSMRKANHLFLLKTLLSFLSILFIPMILKNQNIINEVKYKYSIYTILALFCIIVFFNIRSYRQRNNNRYSMRNFIANIQNKEVSAIPKLTCIGNKKASKTPEESEIETKLEILKRLESKFLRINPSLNLIDNQNKTTNQQMDAIRKEFRDIFGADLSDRAINIAISKRMESRGITNLD